MNYEPHEKAPTGSCNFRRGERITDQSDQETNMNDSSNAEQDAIKKFTAPEWAEKGISTITVGRGQTFATWRREIVTDDYAAVLSQTVYLNDEGEQEFGKETASVAWNRDSVLFRHPHLMSALGNVFRLEAVSVYRDKESEFDRIVARIEGSDK